MEIMAMLSAGFLIHSSIQSFSNNRSNSKQISQIFSGRKEERKKNEKFDK